jgi:hypothetical protein
MQHKKRFYMTSTIVLLTLLICSATILAAKAALGITLTPSSGAPGDSVTVEGTDFAATNNVGIGLGPEVTVTGETHDISVPSGLGPFTNVTLHYPI